MSGVLMLAGVDLPAAGEAISSSNLKLCTGQIEDLMLGNLNRAIAGKLLDSVDVLRDSYTGRWRHRPPVQTLAPMYVY